MKVRSKSNKERIKELADLLSVLVNESSGNVPIEIEYKEPDTGIRIMLQNIPKTLEDDSKKRELNNKDDQLIKIRAAEIGRFTSFVKEGDEVKLSQKIGTIESEGFPEHDVIVDRSLIVKKIYAGNGFVEYGQDLLELKPKEVK